MAHYKLHCFAQSGNAYKVALYLQLAGLDWEPIFIDFFAGKATFAENWRKAVNTMGEAPVLEADGLKRSQSGAILSWLADTTGHFAPEGADGRYEALRWMFFDNHKFTSYRASLRFLLAFAKTGETPVTAYLRQRAKSAYAIVDKHLEGRDFMLGETVTVADFSLAGYVFYPEDTGIDLAEFPAISAWRERLKALPGWVHPYELMPGHPLPEASA